jgi:hypothetical protein
MLRIAKERPSAKQPEIWAGKFVPILQQKVFANQTPLGVGEVFEAAQSLSTAKFRANRGKIIGLVLDVRLRMVVGLKVRHKLVEIWMLSASRSKHRIKTRIAVLSYGV